MDRHCAAHRASAEVRMDRSRRSRRPGRLAADSALVRSSSHERVWLAWKPYKIILSSDDRSQEPRQQGLRWRDPGLRPTLPIPIAGNLMSNNAINRRDFVRTTAGVGLA